MLQMPAPLRGGGLKIGPLSQKKISKNCKKTERVEYRLSCQRVPDEGTQDSPCGKVPEAHRERKNRKNSNIREVLSNKKFRKDL